MNSTRDEYKVLVDRLLGMPLINGIPILKDGLDFLKEDLDKDEYRITIIGEFSSGKSTFINALIGKDILPHGVDETTATVTYVHNVVKDSADCYKVKVHFRDTSTPDIVFDFKDSREKFIEFLTAKSNRDVVKEIAYVDIFAPILPSDDKIVFIDTPGLNGVAEGHRDITLQEIERSHANIFLFGINGIKSTDLSTIESVYKEGSPYFFVINQIDRLNEETPDNRINEFKADVKRHILKGKEAENVFGVSALMALASKDGTIKTLYERGSQLTKDDRSKLLSESGFPLLEERLFAFIQSGEKEIKFLDDVKNRLISLFERAQKDVKYELEIVEANLGDIPAKEEIKRIKERVEKNVESNKKLISNKVSVRLEEVRKEYNKKTDASFSEEYDECIATLNRWDTIEKLESGVKSLVTRVNGFYSRFRVQTQEIINISASDIYKELVDVVADFVPFINVGQGRSATFSKGTFSDLSYKYDNEIEEFDSKISEAEAKIRNAKSEKQQIESEKKELREQEASKNEIERTKRVKLNTLGSRPEFCQTKHVSYERRWYTLWMCRHEVIYYSDNQADIDKWDKEKKELEHEFNDKINRLSLQITRLKQYIKNKDEELILQIDKYEKEKMRYQQRKQDKMKDIEMLKRNARSTYIRQEKEKIKSQLDKFLGIGVGEMRLEMKEVLRDIISQLKDQIYNRLVALYDSLLKEFDARLKKIEERIDLQNNVPEMLKIRGELNKKLQQINNIYETEIARI